MRSTVFILCLLSFGNIFAAEKKAYFAGGCFWCMEKPFEALSGVKEVYSGYIGGKEKNPRYKQVAAGKTGHREAVEVVYEDSKISYETLLEIFWQNVDPTDNQGQFVDRGQQYSPAIYFNDDTEKKLATDSKKILEKLKVYKKPINLLISRAATFYRAESYHQNYYKTNPLRYKFYRYNSGRDQYLSKIWKKRKLNLATGTLFQKPEKKKLEKQLSKIQYKVTQEDGTERAFKNEFWDNKKPGIYVDIISKEPLFSSTHKYKSGTGWPSFTRPLEYSSIIEESDNKFGMKRVEVRSRIADSHLGHVFPDGPKPTGLRYCINSASLEFIPKEKLVERGYAKYLPLFNERQKNGEPKVSQSNNLSKK